MVVSTQVAWRPDCFESAATSSASRRRTGELATVVGEDVSAPGELASAFVVPLVWLIYY